MVVIASDGPSPHSPSLRLGLPDNEGFASGRGPIVTDQSQAVATDDLDHSRLVLDGYDLVSEGDEMQKDLPHSSAVASDADDSEANNFSEFLASN
jgi:hypothetical protein